MVNKIETEVLQRDFKPSIYLILSYDLFVTLYLATNAPDSASIRSHQPKIGVHLADLSLQHWIGY